MTKSKTIPFGPLTEELKQSLDTAISNLKKFKEEITTKKEEVSSKSNEIKSLLDKLKNNKDLNITKELEDHFTQSSENFSKITEMFSQELGLHLDMHTKYLQDDHPKEVTVVENETFTDHVNRISKFIKSLTKKRKKEFDILFSRYENNLNSELIKLKNIETYLKLKAKK